MALLGSDGMAGGSVAIPQSGDFPAQPISSRLSISGAAFGQFQFLACTLTLLLRRCLAALFFDSCLGGGASVPLGDFQAVVGQFLACFCGFSIGKHNAVLLPAGDQHQSDQPPAPGRYSAEPVHASAPPSFCH